MTTENELLEELAAEYYRPPLDLKEHVTAPMLSERTGLSFRTCREQLEKQVKAGALIRFEARSAEGTLIIAYRKADTT